MSKRSGCYYVAITGSFEYFQYFNFKLSIPKKVTLKKKQTGLLFLFESSTTENATYVSIENSPVKSQF